ncbi:MAG: hypothetical protein AB1345_05250 [Chloroflexota bacterium]
MLDDMDFNTVEPEDVAPPEEASNRTFLIAAGVLGGVLLLSLACMAVYAMVILPRTRSVRATQQADIYAQNTAVALAGTQTAQVAGFSPTPSPEPTLAPTSTPSPLPELTETSVLAPPAELATATPTSTLSPLTATVAALLTQAAGLQTGVPTATSTALPTTGFADEIGIPGLLIAAVVLVGLILLTRRLRASTT